MTADRLRDITRFYALLEDLERRLGGMRRLDALSSVSFPSRGVYFFFEPGEERSDSGQGLRVVRIGTHAISAGSKATLRSRLAQHRGVLKSGGGSHRGSIFRLIVGEALAARRPELACPAWGKGSSAPASVRAGEHVLEMAVTAYLHTMPFLWVEAGDPASAASIRGIIERNSIALLSNFERPSGSVIDPPSPTWLGRSSRLLKVRGSGLWNSRHVQGDYDPVFLDQLEALVRHTI